MNDKIAIYLRLSLADGDLKKGSKDESNSIENQRMLLHDYIGKQEDLFGEIVEYVDDGYTGTNFNRPAFQKMIVDLKQGNDCNGWFDQLGGDDSPLAEAILDRIKHDAYKINIIPTDPANYRSMREVYGLDPALSE